MPDREVVSRREAGEEEAVPSRQAVETFHCVTYLTDGGVLSIAPDQWVDAPAAPTAPPLNVDVPLVTGSGQVGQMLNCTMGNWDGEPTAYEYAWKADSVTALGDNTANYVVAESDVGTSITCIVTATNAMGSTMAPPSNAVLAESALPGAMQRTRRVRDE